MNNRYRIFIQTHSECAFINTGICIIIRLSLKHNKRDRTYPLVNIQKAIEAMAIEIVDFSHFHSMVIFHSYVKLPEGKSH